MNRSEKVRVLHIIARLNIGGPAVYVMMLMDELPKDRFYSRLITGTVGKDEGDMSYLVSEKGIRSLFIPELGREISFVDDLKVLWQMVKIINYFKPDIVHTHTAKAGAIGRVSATLYNLGKNRKNRAKLIHTFHGHVFHSYFNKLKTYIFILIERLLGQLTDKIIVVSPLQKYDICRRYKIAPSNKVKNIPLGIEFNHFSNYKTSLREKTRKDLFHVTSPSTVLVGIVGRLTPVKNHHLFIDSVKAYKEFSYYDRITKFVIVGDGELRGELESYAAEQQVENDIIFTGWLRDMPAVYHALDIMTLTSKNEGSPLTLIEAMASKKPVVATDVGGVSNLFGQIVESPIDGYKIAKNGILVSSGDSQSMAKAIRYLISNPRISCNLAQNAQAHVFEAYSKERLIKDIDNLYSELIT